MNIPYVKKFNENGECINPIKGIYKSEYPNRRERRNGEKRFHGESKNIHLTVTRTHKFRRFKQVIICKDKKGKFTGEKRVIEHYLSN